MKIMLLYNIATPNFRKGDICELMTCPEMKTLKNLKTGYVLQSECNFKNFYVEVCCRTCKFNPNEPCMCDSEHGGWIYGGNKMKNEMPELKSGMVVEMNGEKYAVMQLDTGYTYGWGNNGAWCATFLKGMINKIWLMKRPNSINENMLGQSNLDLIWERKPPIDWSKVPDNTKVLCRDKESEPWKKYHFAYYENGVVFAWIAGMTSFSAESDHDFAPYKYVVLYEGNEHLIK